MKTYFFGGASPGNTKPLHKKIPASFYEKIHRVIPIVCVDVVVKRGRSFLLVKRKNNPEKGQWFIPGGRVLKNERLAQAALRKLREETSLRGTVKRLLSPAEHFLRKGYFKGMPSHMISFVYLVEAKSKEVAAPDSQSSDIHWFRRVDRHWHPYVRDMLRLAGFK